MFTDDLLIYIFNGQPHLLAQPMAAWLASSRRFADFVSTFRDKIRKKLRVTQDPESLLDVRLELEAAYLLLQERALSLAYEPQEAGQSRRPDYAVTFTTRLTFMVEVTRLRANPKALPAQSLDETSTISTSTPPLLGSFIEERLIDTISDKLGQLLPQRSNVLLIGVETLPVTVSDLRAALLRIQQRAERNDTAFLQRYRFRDRAVFFNHYQRLSEIVVRGPHLSATEPRIIWVNPQAKYPLPSKVRTVLYRGI